MSFLLFIAGSVIKDANDFGLKFCRENDLRHDAGERVIALAVTDSRLKDNE